MSNRVPAGWEAASFGDLCKFSGGSAFKEKYQGKGSGDYPFIKVSDMNIEGNQRFITKANHWIDQVTRLEAKVKLFPKPAVVFAKVGAALLLNRRRILTRETAIDNNMMAAIPFEDGHNFLYYALQEVDLGEIVQGGAVPSVNQAQMEDIPVLIPPLPEQQKIATILSSVDDVIEKTRAQIDKLKDLKTGMMQELLTKGIGHTEFKDSPLGLIPAQWQVKTTGQLCKSIVPGRNKPLSMSGDIPWLTINDLGALYVSQSKMGYGVTRQVLDDAKGKTVPKCAVIMSCVGEFGITSVAKKEVVINQQLHGFVCGKEIIPEYLCFVLSIKTKEMLNLATQTTIAYMNKANCESVLIPVPNIAEQRKISGILISIDQRLTALNDKWSVVSLIKKALMQDLLTGKVRVNLTDKESAVV